MNIAKNKKEKKIEAQCSQIRNSAAKRENHVGVMAVNSRCQSIWSAVKCDVLQLT